MRSAAPFRPGETPMIRYIATALGSLLLLVLPAAASAQADLRPSQVRFVQVQTGVPAGQAAVGEEVGIELSVRNYSTTTAAGPFLVEFYLSANNNYEDLAQDELMFTVEFDGLEPNATSTNVHRWRVVPDLKASQFYVKVFIDRPNSGFVCDPDTGATAGQFGCVDESGTVQLEITNNRTIMSAQLTIRRPEIVVSGDPTVTIPTGDCYFGQPIEFTYRLCNEGPVQAVGFVDSLLISVDRELNLPFAGQGDDEIDTSPVRCGGEDGTDCGGGGICYDGFCHMFCTGDLVASDCAENLVCAEDPDLPYTVGTTCQNFLDVSTAPVTRKCRTYTRTVTLPETDRYGNRFAERAYYIGVIANRDFWPEEADPNNNKKVIVDPIFCRYPDPDLTPVSLVAPARVAAGETVTIVRKIENKGIISGEAKYRYVLSHNDSATFDDDVVLQVVSTGGDGVVSVGPVSTSEATDLVLVPSNTVEGDYRLGIVIDGEGALRELDDTNNVYVMPGVVKVEKSALRILTRTLPPATVGADYAQHLVAAGGVAAYDWSVDALPSGLSISRDGLISGTPREPGDYHFTVTVKSGQATAWEPLALRVLEPMGPLVITTPSLPPAVKNTPYSARITAQGGKPFSGAGEPPYKCRKAGGTLLGVSVTEDCMITGSSPQPGDPQVFTIELWDSLGNTATKEFTLVVLEENDLYIDAERWVQADAGREYGIRCIRAANGDGKYTWSLEETETKRLPKGMAFFYRYYDDVRPFDPEVDPPGLTEACITGVPQECGSFIVPVRVTDASRQSDSADLPLNVSCATGRLVENQIGPVKRGESVDVQLTAEGAGNIKFRLFYGRLPNGLDMDETGRVSGVVGNDAEYGTYNLIVELSSEVGVYALEPLVVLVDPDVPEIRNPTQTKGGDSKCSTAGGGAGMLPFAVVILALAAAALRRRVAVVARISSFVAVLALAGGADAQTVNHGYLATAPFDFPYTSLQGAIRSSTHSDRDWSAGTDMWIVAMPAGFTFRYFGNTYSHIGISGNGALVPYTSGSPSGNYYVPVTNTALPNTGNPNGIIAPWWDDFARSSTLSPFGTAGGLFYKVEGVYPNRVFKVQWKHLTHYICSSSTSYNRHCNTTRTYSFQAWIYEASANLNSTIVFLYDTPLGPDGTPWGGWETASTGSSASYLPSGTVGLESVDQTKGLTLLSCSPNCTFDLNWPDQKAILITQKADLRALSASGDPIGWAGVPMDVSAEVQNIGLLAASEFSVEFFGSTDAQLDATDRSLGVAAGTQTLSPGTSMQFSREVVLPEDLQPGDYYIIAKADPVRAVDEDFLENNIAVYGPFVIGEAAADATVEAIVVPETATVGAEFVLDWTVRNRGNVPMIDVPYAVVLSDNEVIGGTDLRVATGTLSVGRLTTAPVRTLVTIPSTVRAGQYYLGVVIDPDDVVPEVDEFNNSRASDQPLTTVGGPLQVLTTELPVAAIGSPYCAELRAAGGNGDYTWTVAAGSELPPGLALDRRSARTTLLCGVPAALGSYEFSLQVASGAETRTASVSLTVDASGAPLTVVTLELPWGVFNAPYSGQLVAAGGKPPYEWSLTGGSLPPGLVLDRKGRITGTPMAPGSFGLTVQVTDSAGMVAPRSVTLTVGEPTRVGCVTTELAPVAVGTPVRDRLVAAGGSGNYTWKGVEVRRLASATDAGGSLGIPEPPGLVLSASGEVAGTASTAGRYLWTVEVRDGFISELCLVLVDVTYEQGLTVTTRSLADADVGVPYQAQLEASGGQGITWRLVDGNTLPAGLDLSPSGLISGTLDVTALAGAERKTFAFAVEARDNAGRSGVAALSITLRKAQPAPPTQPSIDAGKDGGCQAGAAAPGMLGVVIALGFIARRRRH